MTSPDLILGTGWTRSLNASVTWPGPTSEKSARCQPTHVVSQWRKRCQPGTDPELKPHEKQVFDRNAVVFEAPGRAPSTVPLEATIVLKPDASPTKTPPYRLPEAQIGSTTC